MTQEHQRILIATACGWTNIERVNSGEFGGLQGNKPEGPRGIVPSYTRDSNSMRAAIIKVINTPILKLEFARNLQDLQDRNPDGSHRHGVCTYWEPIVASPEVLAETLLRTLGLWVEEKKEGGDR